MTDEPHDHDEPLDAPLARAREAIAAPPPPLDDMTRRRLVTRALAESAPRRSARPPNRWPALLAAAAAVAVVALGGWALLSSGHGAKSNEAASKGAALNTTTAPRPHSALGDVSEPDRLLARVRAALRAEPTGTPTTSGAAADSRCSDSVTTPNGAAAQTFGTATYRGAPAVVLVVHDGRETLIYVLDQRDCRLLTSQFLHG